MNLIRQRAIEAYRTQLSVMMDTETPNIAFIRQLPIFTTDNKDKKSSKGVCKYVCRFSRVF